MNKGFFLGVITSIILFMGVFTSPAPSSGGGSGGSGSGSVTNLVNNSGPAGTISGSLIGTNLFTGNTIWVDSIYGTSHGTRNNPNNPFALISQANTIAQKGDTIKVRPGTYFEGNNQWVMQENEIITGDSGLPLIQYSNNPSTVVSIVCTMSNNCVVKDLVFQSLTTNRFCAPLGYQTNSSATNAWIVNIIAPTCDSDGIYDAATNVTSTTVINSYFTGYWDTFANTGSNPNSTWKFYGGEMNCSYTNGSSTPVRRPFNIISGIVFINYTKVTANKSGTGNIGIACTGGTVHLNNVLFDCSSSGYVDITSSGSSLVTGISSCSTVSGLSLVVPTTAGVPILFGGYLGNISQPTDTNNFYGTWSSVYQADQSGDGTGGSLTLTNVNNIFSSVPVSVTFGSDNSLNPGLNVMNGNVKIVKGSFTGDGISTGGNKIPTAITVGGSPFTFVNATSTALHVHILDSAAYTVTLNGIQVINSFIGPYADVLQPTNILVVSYLTTMPTIYTNNW